MNPEEVQKAVVPKNANYGLTWKKRSNLFLKLTFPLHTSRKNFMQQTKKNDAHITEFDKTSTQIGGDHYNKNPDLNSSWQWNSERRFFFTDAILLGERGISYFKWKVDLARGNVKSSLSTMNMQGYESVFSNCFMEVL